MRTSVASLENHASSSLARNSASTTSNTDSCARRSGSTGLDTSRAPFRARSNGAIGFPRSTHASTSRSTVGLRAAHPLPPTRRTTSTANWIRVRGRFSDSHRRTTGTPTRYGSRGSFSTIEVTSAGGMVSMSFSNGTMSLMAVITPVYDMSSTTGRVTPECIGTILRD